LLEEVQQKIDGVQNQKSPLQESQMPLSNKLGEACAMLQTIFCPKEFMDILDERRRQVDDAATNRLWGPVASSIIISNNDFLVTIINGTIWFWSYMKFPVPKTRQEKRLDSLWIK
jgi:hypothetical protein